MATSVPDRGQTLMAQMWVLTIVASITVALRLIFRARKSILGWDDTFMLLSTFCFFGWTIVLTMLCMKGGERHIGDVAALGPDIIAQVQLLNWTSQVFGIMGIGAGKVSVSALLLAIMRHTNKTWQEMYLWTFCIVLVLCVSVSCSILTFAQCHPAAALWDTRIHGTCIKPSIMADYGIFTGAYNTFVDASLALIPSTIFWSLQISSHEKITLSIVFALNILTCICSGIKTSYLSQLANRTDFTWATYDIFAWVTAEFFLVIVCGTVPTLKPVLNFFRRQFGVIPTSTGDSYQRHTGDSDLQSDDAIQLNGFRKDGVKSETVVSNSKGVLGAVRGRSTRDMMPQDIRVEKTFQVKKSQSEEELNR